MKIGSSFYFISLMLIYILHISLINKQFEKHYSWRCFRSWYLLLNNCKEFWHEHDQCLGKGDKSHYVDYQVCGPEMQFPIVFINANIPTKLTIDID